MAIFHEGMLKLGMHKGRSDMKASKGGDKMFGKQHGGGEGVHTKLISSAMSGKMAPKFSETASKGKTKKLAGKSY